MAISIFNKVVQRLINSRKTITPRVLETEESILATYRANRTIPASAFACLAPWTSISFNIDGYATVCCLNRTTTVNVANGSIDEIWKSEAFAQLRENVSKENLKFDCSICHQQIQAKNFTGVKAASYDAYYPYHPERPAFMEFCLDNTCNLACVMCNSLLSSSIRKNEHLPPLEKKYDERFVEQLLPYIPFLKEAVFSGGEPFLIPIYYKIWERMLDLNPQMTIGIVTNGSTLNSRIKDMLEQGRFKINISIDSVHRETYEAVRRNASFDILMNNFEWFKEYGNRKNLPVNIPVCPLTKNWDKIPEVVRFANKNDVSINFVYVDRPFSQALIHSTPEYLEKIIALYEHEKFDAVSTCSVNNVKRFKGLIDDIVKWRENKLTTTEPVSEKDLLHLLEEKIIQCDDILDREAEAGTKEEMILKIKMVLNEIPEGKKNMILKVFNSYSVKRLHHFFEGKTIAEITVFFKEYVGQEI